MSNGLTFEIRYIKFEGNWFRIDGEIAENHAILVNLTVSRPIGLTVIRTCRKCITFIHVIRSRLMEAWSRCSGAGHHRQLRN